MRIQMLFFGLGLVVIPFAATAADKPRVYVTESQATQLAGDATSGDVKGSLKFSGGSSPQSLEVIRSFSERCPAVIVTADREKAEFIVRLDHEGLSPVTPFTRGNKVAVFDKSSDLIYSASTRVLSSAVKGACSAITSSRK